MIRTQRKYGTESCEARTILPRPFRENDSAEPKCDILSLADRYLEMYPEDTTMKRAGERYLDSLRDGGWIS